MDLTEDVLRVLSACRVDGCWVFLPEKLDRKLYLRVNKALEGLGGKWDKGKKAHGFVSYPEARLDQAIVTGHVTTQEDLKQTLGFFPTPPDLAEQLVALAGVQDGHHVLEPSAGGGSILRVLRRYDIKLTLVELWDNHAEGLPFDTVRGDFLSLTDLPHAPFDRIVMNPPFARRADVLHVRHAFTMLKTPGTLVSVMSAGVAFREDRMAREFRDEVRRAFGTIEPLPDGSFKVSGTNVRTVVVTMQKL